jgi:hypothetical protein
MPTLKNTTSEIAEWLLAMYGSKKVALDVAKMFQDRSKTSILLTPEDKVVAEQGWQEVSEAIIYHH